MALEITLSSEKNIVVQPETTKALTILTIDRMVDIPEEKTVTVFIKELRQPIILWEGATYDAIGQWTDADVDTRLKEIYDV